MESYTNFRQENIVLDAYAPIYTHTHVHAHRNKGMFRKYVSVFLNLVSSDCGQLWHDICCYRWR